jgi:NAD(P)-dependent dehydrogenase (short-subunit alcohol dehydrogenase family)
VLVCNAASNPYYGPNEKLPDDVFMKVMQNNILSNMWLINLCLPDMRAKKDGSIMIVSSIGGVRASAVIGAYCISKAADMQLARNLALNTGPTTSA